MNTMWARERSEPSGRYRGLRVLKYAFTRLKNDGRDGTEENGLAEWLKRKFEC